MTERKVNFECNITRRNVTPAAFMAYVRRRLTANGGIDYAGDLDTRNLETGSSHCSWDTTAEDGTHCISVEKPYHLQNYTRFPDGRVYNEIIEFDFDDEKTGCGYYYLLDAEITETPAETAQDAQETAEIETAPETHESAESPAETAETAERAAEEAKPINPMCAECTKRGVACPGTTCQDYTGCIHRETALTRGWVLDELERRDPAGFARWLDSDDDSDYDVALRDYIHPDDDHVKGIRPYLAGVRV